MSDTMVIGESDRIAAESEFATRVLDDLHSGAEETNSAAPYGYTKEGTPRGKPGPKPGRGRVRRGRPSPSRAAPSSAKPKAPAMPDYRAGICGILQMVAAPIALVGMKEPAFAMDAATITLHADSVADGMAQGAMEIPQLQMILDRIMTVGPWGIVVSPLVAMGCQILANHGIIPAGAMGTLTRDELLAHLQGLQAAA